MTDSASSPSGPAEPTPASPAGPASPITPSNPAAPPAAAPVVSPTETPRATVAETALRMESASPAELPSPALAAVLAWMIPGAGHFYIGYNGKALMFLAVIASLMLLGSAMGDWQIVCFPDSLPGLAGARRLGAAQPGDSIWFFIEAGAGLITMMLGSLNKSGESIAGTTQMIEVGHLYVRVGGMLNLLLIADAYTRAQAMWDPPAQPAASAETPASAKP
jgi:TM2 domain-containing membrane protein YozV